MPRRYRWVTAIALAAGLLVLPGWGQMDARRARQHYENAIKFEGDGRLEDAVAALDGALQADPKSHGALRRRGRLLLRLGRFGEAERDFNAALALHPLDGENWVGLGEAQLGQKQYGMAAVSLESAVEHKQESSLVYRLLGQALAGQDKGSLAIEAYTKSIKLRLDIPETYLLRGQAQAGLGRFRDAI